MADALGSGPSGSNPLEVQVLSSVLYFLTVQYLLDECAQCGDGEGLLQEVGEPFAFEAPLCLMSTTRASGCSRRSLISLAVASFPFLQQRKFLRETALRLQGHDNVNLFLQQGLHSHQPAHKHGIVFAGREQLQSVGNAID